MSLIELFLFSKVDCLFQCFRELQKVKEACKADFIFPFFPFLDWKASSLKARWNQKLNCYLSKIRSRWIESFNLLPFFIVSSRNNWLFCKKFCLKSSIEIRIKLLIIFIFKTFIFNQKFNFLLYKDFILNNKENYKVWINWTY